nr:hypothetical protein [Tanacetum cinerariifolium]
TSSTNFLGTKDATSQDVKKDVSSLRYIALLNWFHEAHLESSTSNAQDACNADAPESSGNSNPTATSTNPSVDHMETLTVETPIPTVSSPVPTACLDDSPKPSSDTRLILKRVTSQDDTPSLDNILNLSNRFEDILGVTTNTSDTNKVEADLGNMENNISASPTPTFRIHKDHPTSQIIGPVDTPVQTRNKSKEMEELSFIVSIHHKTNPDLLQFFLFSCFLSQEEPKKISDALKDPRVRPIGTKWVLKNKKNERGIMIRNKARLVAQGHTQEEGIDNKEVFAPLVGIEAIRLFLAYASFMGFTFYQMDVKSAFLYGTIDEEVYVMQPLGFQDPEFPARVYKVEKSMYGLHQAPRAFGMENYDMVPTPMVEQAILKLDLGGKPVDHTDYRSMIGSLMYLTSSRPDIMFATCIGPFNGGNCSSCSSVGSINEFVYDPNPYSYNETPNFYNQPPQHQYETNSYEVIKSSVEDLVSISSESEGIPDNMCDVPFCDNSPPLDISKDQFEDFSDSNDDFTSIDDDYFSIDNIDYVEASPPDSELVSLKEVKDFDPKDEEIDTDILLTIKDDILREKLLNINLLIAKFEALKDNPTPSTDSVLKSPSSFPNSFLEETDTSDNSLPESEIFYFDLEEKRSGNPTSHSNLSLLDYEAFFCNSEPDSRDFIMDVVEDIFDNPTREPTVHMPNILPTHPTSHLDSDFTLSSDSLGSDLVVSFPFGTRNKIFDPRIFFEVQSKNFLSRDTFYISFIRDPLCPVIETLLPFSFKNEDQVFNLGILSSNLLSYRGKIIFDFFENPMMIYGGDSPTLGVPFLHLYPP